MELKTISTPRVPVRYHESGKGQPLVFLHGAGGLDLDQGLLGVLAESFHVYAPLLPGYGDSEECAELRDMLDFTLHTWDVVGALGLKDPILVGFSMGGMIASEMAAVAPRDVSRLALIAPAGLWLDDHPIADIFALLPYELPHYLFHDEAAGAKVMTAGADLSDPAFLQAFLVQNARQLGAAGKILFPIPDRGLASRLYRIQAKTLLIWGQSDKLIPPVYAQAFQRAIAGADLVLIPEAGHLVPFEKPKDVAGAIARLA
ncbi:MAG TPA: alpha/beta fold hydrolase [Candidatus Acidoferrales bacterium]|nr:alpha/beta fold hydrolase [Candidatus Acidoferrales bacterium]